MNQEQSVWRRGNFDIEDYFTPPLKGFKAGRSSNGFESPAFEQPEAMRIARQFGDLDYDAKEDCFICQMGDPDEAPEHFKGFDIEVEGQTYRVYRIGSGFWTWVEVKD